MLNAYGFRLWIVNSEFSTKSYSTENIWMQMHHQHICVMHTKICDNLRIFFFHFFFIFFSLSSNPTPKNGSQKSRQKKGNPQRMNESEMLSQTKRKTSNQYSFVSKIVDSVFLAQFFIYSTRIHMKIATKYKANIKMCISKTTPWKMDPDHFDK